MREYARRKCGKPAERRGELWENLAVVWEDELPPPGYGAWVLSRVVNHAASAGPGAPKVVTHGEIVRSAFGGDVIRADSKEEAVLMYAASGRAKGEVWSIADGKPRTTTWAACGDDAPVRLVRECPRGAV